MARETKVGLIAGLAFIICFAVILANRGRPMSSIQTQPIRIDKQVRTAVSTPRSAPVRVAPREDDSTESSSSPTGIPAGGGAVVLPRGDGLASQSASPDQFRRPRVSKKSLPRGGGPSSVFAEASGHRALTSRLDDPAQRRRLLQERLDAASQSPNTQDPPEGGGRRRPGQAGMSDQAGHPTSRTTPLPSGSPSGSLLGRLQGRLQGRGSDRSTQATPLTSMKQHALRYKVVKGDTLSKIAAVHYGSASKAVIDAVYQANRSSLSSPDVLRIGVELTLPLVDGVDRPSVAGSAAKKTITAPAGRRPDPSDTPQQPFRWYQIKKNDRYISIAREQLQDASRWREIFELNKDKFPDPQRIREGVRIKLPATSVVRAGRMQR